MSTDYDHVNPQHYKAASNGRECIDEMPEFFQEWLRKELDWDASGVAPLTLMRIGFCLGSAFKYRWRKGLKPGQSAELDESKASWYDQFAMHLVDPITYPDPRTKR